MPPSTLLRRATRADASVIAEFNAAMARETEHRELDLAIVTRGVERLFDDAARGFYLLAVIDGEIAGQLMITYEWTDWRDGVFWWIQSVYVAPAFRAGGVFKALYRQVEQEAHADPDARGLRLYVERDNTRAQEVYRRLGMDETPYLMFEDDFTRKG